MRKARAYREKRSLRKLRKDIWRARHIYLMILPVVIWFLLFSYWPMYWLRISFYDFSLYKGFEGSTFVGFENFVELFTKRNFLKLIWNALALNLYSLFVGFPAPIIFALLLNEMRFRKVKKVVQTVSFLPHFISMVALVTIVKEFLSPTLGLSADILNFFGKEPVYFLGNAKYFRSIIVFSGISQELGYSAIVYLSALTALDMDLYEAAMVDGANRWKRLWHITMPGIMPTVMVMLILRIGSLISTGYEKIYLLQNSINLGVSEVISTYVYKQGLLKMDYSTGTTAGLFNSVVAFILVFAANRLSKLYSESAGIW